MMVMVRGGVGAWRCGLVGMGVQRGSKGVRMVGVGEGRGEGGGCV